MQRNIITGMGKSIYQLTEKYARERLKLALSLSEQVHAKKIRFKAGKGRQITRAIKEFNDNLTEMLRPITRMGVDFDELLQFY